MSLSTALVDRARIRRLNPATATQVAGSTRMETTTSAYFDALLQLPQGSASEGSPNSRRRVVKTPTLLFDVFDDDNEPVALQNGDKIEIVSDRFGTAVWETTGDPEPLANLYDILGWQVTLKRVVDHAFTPVGS